MLKHPTPLWCANAAVSAICARLSLVWFRLMNEAPCGVSVLHSALCKTPTESQ